MSRPWIHSPQASLWHHINQEYSLDYLSEHSLTLGEYVVNFKQGQDLSHYRLSIMPSDENKNDNAVPSASLKEGFFDANLNTVIVRATLLDKPLIIGLREPLHIGPHAHLTLNLTRPLSFRVIASHLQAEQTIIQRPIYSMRLTSYGEVTKPMICYHWPSEPVDKPHNGNEALVPLRLENQTKHSVEVRKLILYKGLLKLFKTDHHFITNEVRVLIHSKSEAFIEYTPTPPRVEERTTLVFEPSEEGAPRLLKHLRLRSKRGTGVEYGF